MAYNFLEGESPTETERKNQKKDCTNAYYIRKNIFFFKDRLYSQIAGHQAYHTWNRFSYLLFPFKEWNDEILEASSGLVHPSVLRAFTELTELEIQKNLEESHSINWMSDMCRRLYAIKISPGSGNRLFDAVSTAMYGFDDQTPFANAGANPLMKLYAKHTYRSSWGESTMRRWAWEQIKYREIVHIKQTIEYEWNFMKRAENADPEENGIPIEVYDKMQVYGLCNVLKRPIVVYAEPGQGGDCQAKKLAGVYLPFDNNNSETPFCFPVVVAYVGGRFLPLIQMKSDDDPTLSCLPLVDSKCNFLDVHFGIKPPSVDNDCQMIEPLPWDAKLELMMRYMSVTIVERPSKIQQGKILKFPCARLSANVPEHFEFSENVSRHQSFKLMPQLLDFYSPPRKLNLSDSV